MSPKKLGYSFIGIGGFVVLFMFLADALGLGKRGIQAAQLLGMETGILLALFGYFLVVKSSEDASAAQQWRPALTRFFSSPVTAVVVGVLAAYFLFMIVPMFLNPDLRMQYFFRYLPDKSPIGYDLKVLLDHVKTWFQTGSPYPGGVFQFYPPLTFALFSPLTMVDYRTAYLIITLITLLSYVIVTLVLPIWIHPKGNHSLIFFLFALGLVSYGLQFELERGQYNVPTFLLGMLAIYIYHYHHKYRYIGYFLFSLAVQLKVFPAIFILMFVKDWRDWKGNLKRFAGIGLFNLALLFILGPRVFNDFFSAITSQLVAPLWTWNGNHSIQAFVFNLMKDGYGLVGPETLAVLAGYSSLITTGLLAIFALCLLLLLVFSFRYNEKGLNPYLLMVCSIGALIIPTSNDYTLSFLTAPVAVLLAGIPVAHAFKAKYLASFLVAITSFAFASTLFPFKYKPYFLNNNFPALFVILISITILYFLRNRETESVVP